MLEGIGQTLGPFGFGLGECLGELIELPFEIFDHPFDAGLANAQRRDFQRVAFASLLSKRGGEQ